jgi:hypothetical protein
MNSEKSKAMVLRGERSAVTSFVNACAGKSEIDEEVEEFSTTGLSVFDRKLRSVRLGRQVSGRLRASHLRPMNRLRKAQKRNVFMKMLREDYEEIDDVVRDKVFWKPTVSIHLAPLTRRDKNPQTIGRLVRNEVPDMRMVRATRELGINYRDIILPDSLEGRLLSMSDEEFEIEAELISKKSAYAGMKTTSPTGLPPVRFLNSVRYRELQGFQYDVDIEGTEKQEERFLLNGDEVTDVEPMCWGGFSINEALQKRAILAFCTGNIGAVRYVFYQTVHGEKRKMDISGHVAPLNFITRHDGGNLVTVAFLRQVDMTVIRDPGITTGADDCVRGDPAAMAAYRGYIQSSMMGGFKGMQAIYERHNPACVLPGMMRKVQNPYPFDVESKVVKFSGHQCYIFEGVNSRTVVCEAGMLPPAIVDITTMVPELKPFESTNTGPQWG